MKKILIATKNKGKVDDFKAIFDQDRVEIISLLDLDSSIKDIEETGETFSENAILKAEGIAEQMNLPVLADDSGLSIDYLDGRPGVDRKSTRLNSSHVRISYAVFCLKKKKKM